MATKNTASKTSVAKNNEQVDEVIEETLTAEEMQEQQAEAEELLAGLTMLRQPHELRLASRNKVKTIQLDHGRQLAKILGDAKDAKLTSDLDEDTAVEYTKHMMRVQEAVDEFAESIAIDKPAYIAWSNEHADDYAPFLAILFKYASAAGESTGSAS